MAKKKKGRLTRIVSFLYKHKFLDEDCFEEEELTEDDFWDEGDDVMIDTNNEKIRKLAGELTSDAFIVVCIVGATMAACSAVYYSVKGTVGLFKTLSYIGHRARVTKQR